MTMHRFHLIAHATANHFWPLVFMHLSPEEVNYIKKTPAARRKLESNIALALAQTLLTAGQLSEFRHAHAIKAAKLADQPLPEVEEPLSGDLDVDTEAPRQN